MISESEKGLDDVGPVHHVKEMRYYYKYSEHYRVFQTETWYYPDFY